jgi:hypothetical protein
MLTKLMRPLKYKNLGEMRLQRVSNRVSTILPKLQDVMERLEETGKDSVEILETFLDHVDDTLDQ